MPKLLTYILVIKYRIKVKLLDLGWQFAENSKQNPTPKIDPDKTDTLKLLE